MLQNLIQDKDKEKEKEKDKDKEKEKDKVGVSIWNVEISSGLHEDLAISTWLSSPSYLGVVSFTNQ